MQELPIRQRVEAFVEHGDLILTKADSRPETAPTVSDFQPAHQELINRRAAWLATRDALLRARLELAEADANQDQAVRTAAHTVRDRSGNSRMSNVWLLNFPRGYTEIIKAPMQDERRQILALAERLSAVDDAEIRARVAELRAAAERTGRAFEAVQTALEDERTAYGLLQAEKMNWGKARRRLYNAIQLLYADDRRKAEYFFDHTPVQHKRNGKPNGNGDAHGILTAAMSAADAIGSPGTAGQEAPFVIDGSTARPR